MQDNVDILKMVLTKRFSGKRFQTLEKTYNQALHPSGDGTVSLNNFLSIALLEYYSTVIVIGSNTLILLSLTFGACTEIL